MRGPLGVAVREPVGLREVVDRVQTEPVDPLLQPPVHHLGHVGADVRIAPVQVRLLLVEEVEVPRLPDVVVRPRRPSHERLPVVRRLVGVALAPVVVVLVPLLAPARALEPLVFVAGVVDHKVHHESDVSVVERRQQLLPVGHRPELLADGAVVADVVAVVGVRGVVHRTEPHHVDAERVEVVDPLGDAGDVADPIAVTVVETPRVDLVDDRLLPPLAVRAVVVVDRPPIGRVVRSHALLDTYYDSSSFARAGADGPTTRDGGANEKRP
jgi:hypothetical protein